MTPASIVWRAAGHPGLLVLGRISPPAFGTGSRGSARGCCVAVPAEGDLEEHSGESRIYNPPPWLLFMEIPSGVSGFLAAL